MSFQQLLAPQTRRAEVLAGLAALLAGFGGLALAAWLTFHEALYEQRPATGWLVLFTGLIGTYSLHLAWRLLRRARPRYLVSPIVMALVGVILVYGATLESRYDLSHSGALEGLLLGAACFLLAWRGWQDHRGHPTASDDAT